MSYGFMGKTLRINLTDRSYSFEDLNIEEAHKYIGSRGLGVKTYMNEVDPKIDPFDKDNKLVFVTGPYTGAPVPSSGRYMVVTKSPLTGGIAFANSGGYWGPEFKFAGYDMMIVEGKSETPVYISIVDDKIEFRDADHLWGKLVTETTEILKEESVDKARVMCIGPAGENLSPMAAIMNDIDRAAGRGGVGAVMGSKNLKAITIKGSNKVSLVDEDHAKQVIRDKMKKIREDETTGQGLPAFGTAVLLNIMNENGILPVKNYQESYTEHANMTSGEVMADEWLVKNSACYRCPIACGRVVKLSDGTVVGGPEYETLWAFGPDCGVTDIEATFKGNHNCNEYGFDTISAGATVACAMELYQRGHIKDEEINEGLTLNWGDGFSAAEWIKKMGRMDGLGAKMAQGSYRLADSYGVPDYAMTVKKQEIPAYDVRGSQGMGLTYACNNRGGCHIKGYVINPEILGVPGEVDRFETEGKGALAKGIHDLTTVMDAVGICCFTTYALDIEDFAELYNAICGDVFTAETLLEAGDRIWTLEKIYNLKAGIGSEQDTLPKRLLKEPIPAGPSKGHVNRLHELLPQYYEARGWSPEGIPTDETLRKLGLEEYIGTF